MRIELWSIYFPPVPLGIGPVAGTLARELAARGHAVTAVTSHPHYPKPDWGTSWRVRRRTWNGIKVVELPVYPSRQTTLQRVGEETTYALGQTAWGLWRSEADVVIATVPSLMCVPGACIRARCGTPMVLWLQDIVSQAAQQSGLTGGSRLQPILARLERAAFEHASRTVVISDAFRRQLLDHGAAPNRVERIYLGAPRPIESRWRAGPRENRAPVVLVIGNIGLTQGLTKFVEEFQASPELRSIGAELRITGDGVAAGHLRAAIEDDRVQYLGVVSEKDLERELAGADVGLVTQAWGVSDFNLPSKMATYMACGLPVFAVADPATELFDIVGGSGGGRAVASDDLSRACASLATFLESEPQLKTAAAGSLAFAGENFDASVMAARFESVLKDAVAL